MSFDRLIDLFQLLSSHSTLASRGLTFCLESDAVKIRRGDALIGKWVYWGEEFVLSRPCCPEKRVRRETTTQVLSFMTDIHNDCAHSSSSLS